MNPLETVNRVAGVVRFGIGIVVLGIFAWGFFVSYAGYKATSELDSGIGEIGNQFRQAQQQELNDRVLAADGWGEGAHVESSSPADRRSMRAEAIDMIEDRDGDWGIGTQ